MERITIPGYRYHDDEFMDSGVAKFFNRLAAYEDTGLEPEDLKKAFNETAILKLAAQALSTTPDHLRDILQAEQDGRLVVLPCKVGDTVFKPVVTDEGLKCVWPISINNFSLEIGVFNLESYSIGETENGSGIRIGIDDFGKTVFLTREEAALAGKGSKNE